MKESLHKILNTFAFADAPSWQEVKDNYHLDRLASHPDREDIRQHGIREPIAVDYGQSPPQVVDGHTRLIHAEALGLTHVPVKNTTFAEHHYYGSLALRSAAEPDGHLLSFEHADEYNGGSRWPYSHTITATHPERGEVGSVKYWTSSDRSNAKIKIDKLEVGQDHRRRGYGSALMDELQRRHPKSSIDHGDRTDMGKSWWSSYGEGKSDRRGRTAAHSEFSREHTELPDELLDDSQRRALDRLKGEDEVIRGDALTKLMREHGIHRHDSSPEDDDPDSHTNLIWNAKRERFLDADQPLHTSQDYLHRPTLEKLIRSPMLVVDKKDHYGPRIYREDDPQGRYWLQEGHHRTMADRMTQRSGWSYDLRETNRQRAEREQRQQATSTKTAGSVHTAATQTCERCHGSGKHPLAEEKGFLGDAFRNQPCPTCKGAGTQSFAEWSPTDVPEHQRNAFDEPDWQKSKNQLLDVAKDRTPGTKVWRGEVRHRDDLDPTSVGLHWSVNPDQIVTPAEVDEKAGHHRVIYEGVIEHRDQAFPRSHPMFHGRHRSMDSEAEVRFKPGEHVRLTRRYVHDNSSGDTGFAPRHPDRTAGAWQAHDMDKRVEIAHKPTTDTIDYTDVGVRHGLRLSRLAFLPTRRLFGPTYGLDRRLFDGDHLKPDVRRYILETLADFWKPKHGVGWGEWAIVYLAGSEASEWTSEERIGNNDFDVLIGVDYDKFRGNRGNAAEPYTDQEITDELNADFKLLNAQTAQAYIPVDGKLEGPLSNTWYVNPDSYDIRKIKPYAAYDVSHDRWAVKPPHLPKWDISQFPEGPALVAECQAVSAYVRAILNMPEPYRTQQGYALWHHLHSDRSRAFSGQGEGWYDPGNVIEKWLDQEGLWEELVKIMVRVKEDPSTMNAPKNWSNTPVLG